MDLKTLQSYNNSAADYAREWRDQDPPEDMYALLRRFFKRGKTVDIGCGAGRDVAWLASNGFDACGFDASENLLAEARSTYPRLSFDLASLPELDGLEIEGYQNVLCETVIMHLPPEKIASATSRLLDILLPGGTLYLSWRVTEGETQRDKADRLYTAFARSIVTDAIGRKSETLYEQDVISVSSGKRIERIIARKS